MSPRKLTLALTVLLAALPELLHLLPIIAWGMFGDGSLADVWRFAIAVPGREPALPPLVNLWTHHLHCLMHSAVVAGAATSLSWMAWRALLFALLGWWSHIVIDVFTHSADYYPSPVLYPITQQGFDGLAWNTPWFLVANSLRGMGAGPLHVAAEELCGQDGHADECRSQSQQGPAAATHGEPHGKHS